MKSCNARYNVVQWLCLIALCAFAACSDNASPDRCSNDLEAERELALSCATIVLLHAELEYEKCRIDPDCPLSEEEALCEYWNYVTHWYQFKLLLMRECFEEGSPEYEGMTSLYVQNQALHYDIIPCAAPVEGVNAAAVDAMPGRVRAQVQMNVQAEACGY